MENQTEIELLVQQLQGRIGQLVSQYETELAAVKVQAHTQIEELKGQIEELKGTNG